MREFTYLGDRVNAAGGCEAAVIGRTRCGWAECEWLRESCDVLLYGRRFCLGLKFCAKIYEIAAIFYESEVRSLNENEMDGNVEDRYPR